MGYANDNRGAAERFPIETECKNLIACSEFKPRPESPCNFDDKIFIECRNKSRALVLPSFTEAPMKIIEAIAEDRLLRYAFAAFAILFLFGMVL